MAAGRPASCLPGIVAMVAALLSGCASDKATRSEPKNPDPFEPFNRAMYKVNDVGDRYIAMPAVKAYQHATPSAFRIGMSHFLDNLRYPITIVNDFLQGKVHQGGADVARFAVNSTVGLFGLFDPAGEIGLGQHDEDFGQTLAVWGVPQGPYLVVPVFGPYTVTSAFGALVDTQTSPLVQLPQDGLAIALWGAYLVDTRYRLVGIDQEVRQAFDPYVFVRDAYLQNRRFKIYDGRVPEDEPLPDDEPDEPTR